MIVIQFSVSLLAINEESLIGLDSQSGTFSRLQGEETNGVADCNLFKLPANKVLHQSVNVTWMDLRKD